MSAQGSVAPPPNVTLALPDHAWFGSSIYPTPAEKPALSFYQPVSSTAPIGHLHCAAHNPDVSESEGLVSSIAILLACIHMQPF